MSLFLLNVFNLSVPSDRERRGGDAAGEHWDSILAVTVVGPLPTLRTDRLGPSVQPSTISSPRLPA